VPLRASLPADVAQAYETAQRDNRHDLLATAMCTEMCSELIDEGVEHLHFYTLNQAGMTRNICRALGVTPDTTLMDVA